MRFRPCIDLHHGQVKQIVGSTLSDSKPENLRINFASTRPASYYASMYRQDGLSGGHVIMLGPGNEDAARDALHAFPQGLHLGGGITADNAAYWLDQGAEAVIVTSFVFRDGQILESQLKDLVRLIGKDKLVLDLSCRKRDDSYFVVTDRWQKFTDVRISPQTLAFFAGYCCEFLVHAADVEGKCAGVALDLVQDLGAWTPLPTTYAGGVGSMNDLLLIRDLGQGRLDATIGSALDIFGGAGLTYAEVLAFHKKESRPVSLTP